MSSFKKAIPKRKYRERAQPASRQHLGLLEKKRDYKERALDTHQKEKTLQRLREQAFNKNPDEFYFGMEHSRLIGAKHRKEAVSLDPALQKKQKILDSNLLTMKVQNKSSKHSQWQSQLHLIDAPAMNTHVIFVKDKEELEKFDPAEHFDTAPELVDKKANRVKKEQIMQMEFKEFSEPEGYKMLEEVIKEERVLKNSLGKVSLERKLMGNERYQVVDEEKKVYKWFRERKR